MTDHILFGTLGTLLSWISRGHIDPTNIKKAVWDAAELLNVLEGRQVQFIRMYRSVNYCHRATIMDKSVDTFEQHKRFLSASFRNFKKHLYS